MRLAVLYLADLCGLPDYNLDREGKFMKECREAVIVSCGRAPVGKAKKGSYSAMHPAEYAYQVLQGVLKKVPGLDWNQIDDIVVGCSNLSGVQGNNVARIIAQRAGVPDAVPATSITRFCASGLQALSVCANAIICGQADIMLAGGVETMSLLPMGSDPATRDAWLEANTDIYMTMGMTAENVAERYHITREEMERFAAASHQKAARARREGVFTPFQIPVMAQTPEGERLVTQDEGIREDTSMEALAKLKPCFKENGLLTAGTSSQTSDGAAFALFMSEDRARELSLKPIARFVSFAARGVAPDVMGLGPIEAVPRVLQKAGMSLEQMDVIELNEAFASQAIACIRELKLDPAKVNPNGGAIAMGHPMGATGINLLCNALSQLMRHGGRYALVTMCIGGGMGAAAIFESLL